MFFISRAGQKKNVFFWNLKNKKNKKYDVTFKTLSVLPFGTNIPIFMIFSGKVAYHGQHWTPTR